MLDKEEEMGCNQLPFSWQPLYSTVGPLLKGEFRPFEYLGKRACFHLLALNFSPNSLQKHLNQGEKKKKGETKF